MSLVWGGISPRTGVRAYSRAAVPGIDVIVAGARLLCGVVTRFASDRQRALYTLTGNASPL
jgi:hypothetical protein